MSDVLKWTRVMAGEYKGYAPDGSAYCVDFVSVGCPCCEHQHEYWELTGAGPVKVQYPSMRLAKVAAELYVKALAAEEKS